MPARVAGAALLGLAVSVVLWGCGGPSTPTGVATNPPVSGSGPPVATATPSSGVQTSGTRTVLSSISLNVRKGPSRANPVIGSASRGTQLTVLGHVDDNGGWYQVQGQTTTGWITADPDLSAPGQFQEVNLDDKMFDALYPIDWTYANATGETIFRPQTGNETIVVRPASTHDGLGSPGLPGYLAGATDTVVACGYTGLMTQYAAPAGATPQPTTDPTGGQVTRLAGFAQLWLRFNSTHFLSLEFNYSTPDQLQTFRNFYNGIVYPFPQCEKVGTPSPSPTP